MAGLETAGYGTWGVDDSLSYSAAYGYGYVECLLSIRLSLAAEFVPFEQWLTLIMWCRNANSVGHGQ